MGDFYENFDFFSKYFLYQHLLYSVFFFHGIYFENYPLQLQAVPDFGYRFSHWEGALSGTERKASLTLEQKKTPLRAVFVQYHHPEVLMP